MADGTPDVRIGFLADGDEATPHLAGMLRVEDGQTLIEIPLAEGATGPFAKWFRDWAAPTSLIFQDGYGAASLSGLRARTHASSGHAVDRGVLEVGQLVQCGVRAPDFSEVHGVRSEIAGLPRWMEPRVFRLETRTDNDGRIQGATFAVDVVPATAIPGVPGLLLSPSFRTSHEWADGMHSMRETTQVETRFANPRPWAEHIRLHRTLQDLVSLAFWQACDLAIQQAKRDDDPEVTLDDEDHDVQWRAAVVPSAGRGPNSSLLRPLATNRRPLFTFADIGATGVERWYREYGELGQAMWVLAASLFRSGSTIEVQLLQVGVALEALGYELAARSGRVTRGAKDNSFTFETALRTICDSTDCSLDRVLDGDTAEQWATAFNAAYKGVKHADNPLPDPAEAHQRSEQGALLARLWLARHLGAKRDELEKRIPAHV